MVAETTYDITVTYTQSSGTAPVSYTNVFYSWETDKRLKIVKVDGAVVYVPTDNVISVEVKVHTS